MIFRDTRIREGLSIFRLLEQRKILFAWVCAVAFQELLFLPELAEGLAAGGFPEISVRRFLQFLGIEAVWWVVRMLCSWETMWTGVLAGCSLIVPVFVYKKRPVVFSWLVMTAAFSIVFHLPVLFGPGK